MIVRLHKNARTMPAIRAEIAASTESVAALAARYHVGEGTHPSLEAAQSFHRRLAYRPSPTNHLESSPRTARGGT